jgi:hypothetical protein
MLFVKPINTTNPKRIDQDSSQNPSDNYRFRRDPTGLETNPGQESTQEILLNVLNFH